MSRLLVRLVLLTTIFAVLLVLVRAVGAQSKHPLANTFTEVTLANGQKQACWNGICPRKTTVYEAIAVLNSEFIFDGDSSREGIRLCWANREDSITVCLPLEKDIVRSIELYYRGLSLLRENTTMRLGDLITLWGNPVLTSGPFCAATHLLFSNDILVQVLWATTVRANGGYSWTFDPALPAIGFIKIGDSTKGQYLAGFHNWQGFVGSDGPIPCGGE